MNLASSFPFGIPEIAHAVPLKRVERARLSVDRTGLDIIACCRPTRQRLGITVKSRTRIAGREAVQIQDA